MNSRVKQIINILYSITGTYNPFIIAELLNIDIHYKNLCGHPLGHCSKILKEAVIVLDSSIIDSPVRFFICAHELCHAIKHSDIASYYSLNELSKGKLEYEADIFAFELTKLLFSTELTEESITDEMVDDYGINFKQ